jgi:hypothetical protein
VRVWVLAFAPLSFVSCVDDPEERGGIFGDRPYDPPVLRDAGPSDAPVQDAAEEIEDAATFDVADAATE